MFRYCSNLHAFTLMTGYKTALGSWEIIQWCRVWAMSSQPGAGDARTGWQRAACAGVGRSYLSSARKHHDVPVSGLAVKLGCINGTRSPPRRPAVRSAQEPRCALRSHVSACNSTTMRALLTVHALYTYGSQLYTFKLNFLVPKPSVLVTQFAML